MRLPFHRLSISARRYYCHTPNVLFGRISPAGRASSAADSPRQGKEITGFDVIRPAYPSSPAAGGLGGGKDPQLSGSGNRLRPVVSVKFAVDVAIMDLDRIKRQIEPCGDFSIHQALGNEL